MTSPRTIHDWQCRRRTVRLGERTLVMGILNVTPDSFSDGGEFIDRQRAVERALEMAAQGADIIDIGGESTRPGAEPVSEQEEIRRTCPVIREVRARSRDILLSIDTTKAAVAREALEAGADIINDISALEADPAMVEVATQSGAGVILMHRKGTPRTMQENPSYADVVEEVSSHLERRIAFAEQRGISRDHIVIDPGIGFGKTVEHNIALLHDLPALHRHHCPLLIGASRKSFIGRITGRTRPEDRLPGSLGAAAWSMMHGAHILRVHDVIDTCDLCRMLDTFTMGEV